MSQQLVKAPASSAHTKVEQLAYLEAYDAVLDGDYALVVYAETKTASGQTVVKIKSKNTPGSTFDPSNESFRKALRRSVVQGEDYLGWGFCFSTSESDPRVVETHVYGDEQGRPTALEVHLVTRKLDGSAGAPQVARIPWPT